MAHVFDGKLYFTRDHMQGNFIPKNLKLPELKPASKPRAKVKVHSYHALTHVCVGSCMCCAQAAPLSKLQ